MNHDKNNEGLQKLEEELLNIYPSFQFETSGGTSINDHLITSKYEFSVEQSALNQTSYEIKTQKEFIHYTSFSSFFEILNSKILRLYDLNHLNDPQEFNFLIDQNNLKISKESIELFKKSLFLTSLCKYDENEKDDFNLWRLYGDNGNGIAIVFEIENQDYTWYNFLIGKVNYDNQNEINRITQAVNVINRHIDKGLLLDRIPKLIGFLLLLNKNKIWSIEKEYRLMTFLEYDSFDFSPQGFDNPFLEDKIKLVFNRNLQQVGYLEFPLEYKLEEYKKEIDTSVYESFIKIFPRIRIKKIIAGYNLNESTLDELRNLLLSYGLKNLGHLLFVDDSKYKGYFKK